MKHYQINVIGTNDNIIRLWPGSGFCDNREEAEERFEHYQTTEAYLGTGRANGVLYPLVLSEFENEDQQYWQGEELDRYEPGIIFDGEEFDADSVKEYDNRGILTCGNREYYLFESSEVAGEAAADRWRDMAQNDRREFACIIGEERLVGWALGESDNFGISSLEEFLEVAETVPEEEWASYDHTELDIDGVSQAVIDELGFTPTVAYRWN